MVNGTLKVASAKDPKATTQHKDRQAHSTAVKWLKRPNLAAEVKRALTHSPDGKLWVAYNEKGARIRCDCGACEAGRRSKAVWHQKPVPVREMTQSQIRVELKRIANSLPEAI